MVISVKHNSSCKRRLSFLRPLFWRTHIILSVHKIHKAIVRTFSLGTTGAMGCLRFGTGRYPYSSYSQRRRVLLVRSWLTFSPHDVSKSKRRPLTYLLPDGYSAKSAPCKCSTWLLTYEPRPRRPASPPRLPLAGDSPVKFPLGSPCSPDSQHHR